MILDGTWKTILQYAQDHPPLTQQVVCAQDFAFKTYVLGMTPPPTGTGGSGESRDSGSPMLLFAGLAAAAAFVTIVSTRRLATSRR
jgi:hypothetical protein